MSRYSLLQKMIAYIAYIILIVFFITPILYTIALSFKTSEEILQPVNLFNFFPRAFTFENYGRVLENVQMGTYILNSAKLVVGTSIGVLLVGFPAAFALSRGHFTGKSMALLSLLFFQMVSPIVISIPIYWFYSKLGMLDTFWGIQLIYIAIHLSFTIFLLKGVFDSIPRELDEAAKMDGCNRLGTMLRIVIPVSIPGVASAIIFNSINAWSQFIIPFFLISKNKLYPVSVGILQAQGSYQDISTHYLAAASVIGLLPAVILVLFLQKFILRALLSGSVKG